MKFVPAQIKQPPWTAVARFRNQGMCIVVCTTHEDESFMYPNADIDNMFKPRADEKLRSEVRLVDVGSGNEMDADHSKGTFLRSCSWTNEVLQADL
ncbi:unnamed protein product [Angiostrongylus costaricensis]|uniref:CN hydrolase domain-containing protein n=1 Tax=Angiostrongylus costaricensis TaxID=334426 RepID=A0A0R3PI99_ANGCS|nr:unnamed protein product [Angiostrongylus costaricensis]